MQKDPEAFRTISEAADELDVPQHVLRFWETRFSQIRPMKRAGGRRYYRPQDIDLLKGIRKLLYDDGYTIKGVQKILRQHGVAHVVAIGRGEVSIAPAAAAVASATIAPSSPATSAAAVKSPGPAVVEQSAPDGAGASAGELSSTQRQELRDALHELERARALLQTLLAEDDARPAAGSVAHG